jgi:inner membrane protein
MLLAAVMYLFTKNFWKTYAVALIAMATHPALDYLNPYGLRPFLPWSSKWYYGDAVVILDPWIDLVLLAGLFCGSPGPKRKRIAALVSLAIAGTYIGARIQLHSLAASNVAAFSAQSGGVEKSAVLPDMLNPLNWVATLKTNIGFVRFPVHALRPISIPLDEVTPVRSSDSSGIAAYASAAASAAALLRFARFPVTQVERLPSGFRVTFFDFRFYRGGTALGSEVILDSELRVTSDNLSFDQRVNQPRLLLRKDHHER